jgi:hypothetical protein
VHRLAEQVFGAALEHVGGSIAEGLGSASANVDLGDKAIDVPSCNFGVSPTKNPDVSVRMALPGA